VTVIDIDNDAVVKTVTTGASPQQVAIEGVDGNYYVVNRLGNSVSVFDARNDREIGAFAVGVNPWRIGLGMDKVLALNENGNRLDSVSIAEELNTLGDTTAATEWYHAEFDHFFHSTSGRENRLINDGMLGQAWDRTYEFFRVWTQGGPSRVQVCRFLQHRVRREELALLHGLRRRMRGTQGRHRLAVRGDGVLRRAS
jgi:YVTN family beta-propeller protein